MKSARVTFIHIIFGGFVSQQYLPDAICDHVYYTPSANGAEKNINVPPPFIPKRLKKDKTKEKPDDNR